MRRRENHGTTDAMPQPVRDPPTHGGATESAFVQILGRHHPTLGRAESMEAL